MTGGMGNQMFQYALYLKYKSLGVEAKFDDFTEYVNRSNARPIELSVFDIDYPVATREDYCEYTDSFKDPFSRIRRLLTGRKSREYSEIICTFDEEVLKQDKAYITGYFQSEKYFADIKEEVLRAFTFNEKTIKESEVILTKNGLLPDDLLSDREYVGIHIRRGDYLAFPGVYGNICTEDYYDRAIKLICDQVENPVFLIFSNDIPWCAEWIKKYPQLDIKVIEGSNEDTGYIDMYLMSLCKHNILANSSFSWWGAYLNRNAQKKVVVPAKWLNNHDETDIYTEDMIRI